MRSIHRGTERDTRKPAKRACTVCRRPFKPLTDHATRCGACQARAASWLVYKGVRR